jgi:hypothetical protein
MGTKIPVRKISFNARNLFSVRLSAQSLTCLQAYTVRAWSLIVKRWTPYSGAWQQRITDSPPPLAPTCSETREGIKYTQLQKPLYLHGVTAGGGIWRPIMSHVIKCVQTGRATWHLCSHVTSASVTLLCVAAWRPSITSCHIETRCLVPVAMFY